MEDVMKGMRILLSVMVCATVLAGCSGGGGRRALSERVPAATESLREAAPAVADVESSAKAAPSPQGGAAADQPRTSTGSLSNLPQERMVIKSATLAVRVRDVRAAYARAVQLAEAGGGYVQTSTESEEGGERADVTIRVPPHGFLPLIASLGALGTVTTKTISGEDVTQEYYDLGAELDNQMEVRGRLFQLLKQAVKVQDAIAVEEQLERIGANVNRIKGRMKYLETMTGMSTITVTLYSEERAAAEGFINWSLVGHGFFRAAQILVEAFFVILQVLVVAIPLLVVLGAAAWGGILLVRRVRKWRGLPEIRGPGSKGDEGRGAVRTAKAPAGKK
jgi:hypothetical protein